MVNANPNENLGAADRIIQSLLAYQDHMVHNRAGMVTVDRTQVVGVRWEPVTHRVQEGQKVVFRLVKETVGRKKKQTEVRIGTLREDKKIMNGGPNPIAEYRDAGLFPEVAQWLYRQVAEVWKLDNEFAARWASYAFGEEHRDLKVVLAAFMLVQNRKGDPVMDAGKVAFYDEDYRDVGEAMLLLNRKDDRGFNPKMLLRVHDFLKLPVIAQINRELGFGNSARNAFLGRWPAVVEKWLRYREENPKVLQGLVKAGFKTTVMELAERVRYKPSTPNFFKVLRWGQAQADDGRRSILIGEAVAAAESWEGLTEEQICEKITKDKPDWKRVTSMVPQKVGITRAIMAALIEAGGLSGKDLLILTPTLEELGLLEVKSVKVRWDKAVKDADDMRAANIARNVKSKEVKEKLQEAADNALQKVVEKIVEERNLRIYFLIDISGSMEHAIEQAKALLAKFVQGFPVERTHVAVFSTAGRLVEIKHASAAGVENAFRGIKAGGGTDHGSAVKALSGFKPKPDEDALFIWVGDEGQQGTCYDAIVQSGLRPVAFGLVRMPHDPHSRFIRDTAVRLGIPCFNIDLRTFEDPYAIPRTLHNLIAATPVGKEMAVQAAPRFTLVEKILKTDLLKKPAWAD